MMQEVGTAVIVLGAVAFLVRQLFGRAPKSKVPTTFVPIGDLKKKKAGRDCH